MMMMIILSARFISFAFYSQRMPNPNKMQLFINKHIFTLKMNNRKKKLLLAFDYNVSLLQSGFKQHGKYTIPLRRQTHAYSEGYFLKEFLE